MSDRTELVDALYRAFATGDAETMAAAYHPDATFADPVFALSGEEIGDMWRMFCATDNLVGLDYEVYGERDGEVTAHWEPRYQYGAKRRQVHNRIDSRFEFDGNLIKSHRDQFDLASWSKQALGLPGALLGRTPWLQAKIRAQAAAQLARFSSSL